MTASNMKKPFALMPLLIVIGIIAVGIYGLMQQPRKDEVAKPASPALVGGFSRDLAKGAVAGVLVHAEPRDIAPFTFQDASGAQQSLEMWKGRVVLLNLWATWCLPCRKEMPDIASLKSALGGPDFDVIALSVDRKGLEASQAFLKEIGVTNLAAYVEPEAKSLAALQALGLPATILIDRNGKERARLLGPTNWSTPEAVNLVKTLLSEK